MHPNNVQVQTDFVRALAAVAKAVSLAAMVAACGFSEHEERRVAAAVNVSRLNEN